MAFYIFGHPFSLYFMLGRHKKVYLYKKGIEQIYFLKLSMTINKLIIRIPIPI